MINTERGLTLIDSAKKAGAISEESRKALGNVDPKKFSLGAPVDKYKGDDVLLAATLIDDSGSLNMASNAEAVRIGHNAVIQALLDSERPSAIWFHTRYLHGWELNPWNQLEKATKMDRSNYRPDDGTPLYDETAVILGSIIAKTQEFRNNWTTVRSATLIVTDGADNESRLQTAAMIKSIVTDMYATGIHIIAAMGIDDGSTDFRRVFIEMGIRENLILIPGSTPDEIRKAFGLFGKMARQASNFDNFDSTFKGGFLSLPPGEK